MPIHTPKSPALASIPASEVDCLNAKSRKLIHLSAFPILESETPNPKFVNHVVTSFGGEQNQIPPLFSAKKQNGRRLYKIARSGGSIEIKPHRITVYDIKLVAYNYPMLRLIIHCSSGTYIRALARDIGTSLKTGGYVSSLNRTAIGPFHLTKAIALEKCQDVDGIKTSIIPTVDILMHISKPT